MVRFFKKLLLCIQQNSMLHSKKVRPILVRWAGANVSSHVHIGEHVIFDTLYPEDIEIGYGSVITMRCIILTHFYKPNSVGKRYIREKVRIGERFFVGCGSIICNAVEIGDDSVIAAGSVVTKNIPQKEIWGEKSCKIYKKKDIF